ncbi:hypothetical protein PHISCL_05055 [Aspergillus sclerotialis]|uniref:Uncharacterized protein n=1 Tax=Aspergillus sclerotialis TaxID=2070753 RepID=A0A3A2ZME2_9EURO|nr:hypothetical protein PHISCL_05055 [Aspergillus sclerotialis]
MTDPIQSRNESLLFKHVLVRFSQRGCGDPDDATSEGQASTSRCEDQVFPFAYLFLSFVRPDKLETNRIRRTKSNDYNNGYSVRSSSNSNSSSNGNNKNSEAHLSTLIITLTPSATKEDHLSATPFSTSSSSDGLISEPESSKKPIGAIIGGTLGGLAVLIAILALLFARYRKLRGQPVNQNHMAYPFAHGPTSLCGGSLSMHGQSPDMSVAGWPTRKSANGRSVPPVVEAEAKVISELPAGRMG